MKLTKKFWNIAIPVVVGLAALVLGYFSRDILPASLFESKNVARINGEAITAKEFETFAKFYRIQSASTYEQLSYYTSLYQQYGMQVNPEWAAQIANIEEEFSNPEKLGQAVLDLLTENVIIETEGKKLGLSVSEDEISKLLFDSFGYYPQGTPTLMPTPTQYTYPTLSAQQLELWVTPTYAPTATLTPTATVEPDLSVTEEAAEQAAENTDTNTEEAAQAVEGSAPSDETAQNPTPAPTEVFPTATLVSEESYLASLQGYLDTLAPYGLAEANLRQLIYYNMFYNKVYDEITKDVAEIAEQVWARHILVSSEEEAMQVVADLEAGENWWVEAYYYTQDINGQSTGGDLGWFPRGIYSEEIDTAAFEMEIGETRVVQDVDGWHVLQVTGHEQERPLDSTTREKLKSVMFNTWLDDVKARAKITIYDTWKSHVPTEPALPGGN